MKAPEKIYLWPSDRAGEDYDAEWSIIPCDEGGVEYIQADAFIEKAKEYLSKHQCEYIDFDDFRKAMKG